MGDVAVTPRGLEAPGAAPGPRVGLRIGVDVGGTFTKAVAVRPVPFALVARAVVPTSHDGPEGVMVGVAAALDELLGQLGEERRDVDLVAFSTTQAMNALLEGDVPVVGVIGLGARPDLRKARKRTRVGSVALAPGRTLRTEHEFLDLSDGAEGAAVEAAIDRLVENGCASLAISGAFSVESPEQELAVAAAARERGLPVCCGHELSEAYGLETRTVSAAINAAILPVVARTAGIVESALETSGLRVPLLVLRGDGGGMNLDSFRARPAFTVGSGPAAGVAAALHQVGAGDAVVVECGGTSTNVSAVKRGRPALRSIKVMGTPTAIRSIDSWVVGVAGGSMIRLGRRGVAGVGPRSAHLAGLPYACFADPDDLADARPATIAPREGDPREYAAVEARGGRFAVTATCAANALGIVPEDAHAHGSQAAARLAFEALAGDLRASATELARAVLDAALEELETSIAAAAGAHRIDSDAPLILLGGAGAALVPELGERLGRPVVAPAHPEVLASIGAALTLIRVELARSSRADPASRAQIVRDAELACVDSGAAPGTVMVETSFDTAHGVLRAVATGSVALESGAAGRAPASAEAMRDAARRALGADAGASLQRLSESDFYAAYATGNGSPDRVAIVDRLGSVPVTESARQVVTGSGEDFLAELQSAIEGASLNLGIASILPRVTIACGPRLLDLSDSRRPDELLAAARVAVDAHDGDAIAVVVR